jgi:hypothetical protein
MLKNKAVEWEEQSRNKFKLPSDLKEITVSTFLSLSLGSSPFFLYDYIRYVNYMNEKLMKFVFNLFNYICYTRDGFILLAIAINNILSPFFN